MLPVRTCRARAVAPHHPRRMHLTWPRRTGPPPGARGRPAGAKSGKRATSDVKSLHRACRARSHLAAVSSRAATTCPAEWRASRRWRPRESADAASGGRPPGTPGCRIRHRCRCAAMASGSAGGSASGTAAAGGAGAAGGDASAAAIAEIGRTSKQLLEAIAAVNATLTQTALRVAELEKARAADSASGFEGSGVLSPLSSGACQVRQGGVRPACAGQRDWTARCHHPQPRRVPRSAATLAGR